MHSQGQEEKQKQPLALVPRRREGKPSPRVSHQTWRHAVSPVALEQEHPLRARGPRRCQNEAREATATAFGVVSPRPGTGVNRPSLPPFPVPSISLPSLPISFQFIYFSDLNPHLVV